MTWDEAAELAPVIHERWRRMFDARNRAKGYRSPTLPYEQMPRESRDMITAWVLAAWEAFEVRE
jgi:hypothetical protein